MVAGDQTVFVVEDDPTMRSLLGALTQSMGLSYAAFASAREFLDAYEPSAAGCILLDLGLPGMSGVELQTELNLRGAVIPVIFISGQADVSTAVAAMRQGAFDFLQKPFSNSQLIERVSAALAHDRLNRETLKEMDLVRARLGTLTRREREVLDHVARGLSNKAMAQEMALSQRTIELHRSKVMDKMCAKSIAHLVRMVMNVERDSHPTTDLH
jgi:FixJ family two-component response regulator